MLTSKLFPEKIKDLDGLTFFLKKKFGKSIDFDITYEDKDGERFFIYLNTLEVAKRKRRKGYGTKFMTDLCTYADHVGLRIKLMPFPFDKGITTEDLEKFYRKFGFRYQKSITGKMIRCPKKN